MEQIKFIDEVEIKNKTILLRADFDVSLKHQNQIADDIRIRSNIPTIKHLLAGNNKIICVGKLNRPEKRDEKHSFKIILDRVRKYLPDNKITLVDDFLTEKEETFKNQTPDEILLLENIRFYEDEKLNKKSFSKKLADLADVYVNDCFAMCHRVESSVVGVPEFIDGYGGILLKKEIKMIDEVVNSPQRPLVTILGGAKIAGKINLVHKFLEFSDHILIGGGIANTFFAAQGIEIGKSIVDYEEVENAKQILYSAAQNNVAIHLPSDVVLGNPNDGKEKSVVKKVNEVPKKGYILDIGPEAQAKYGSLIAKANSIIWNGPMGMFENDDFRRGTDFIYYSITQNKIATSIIGGGDTLAAIKNKAYAENINHISTGGGAMLEYIEKGTLPGIKALKN